MMENKKPQIHESARIHPTAFINDCVTIGENVTIGPNCSIGYDGFEFPRVEDGSPELTPHHGGVIIGNGVDIQANCAIARAILPDENTIVGDNTKLDNHIHIAHNCRIGIANIFAAGVIFGGSVIVEDYNFLGLNSTIKPGVHIGSYNLIGMGSCIISDIPDHEIWAGNPGKKLRDNLMFKKK